jgi:hypothetical protein
MLDTARARRYLKDFDHHTLFIEELGWDHHRQELVAPVDGQEFRLQAIAHKRGLVAFRCAPAPDGRIPPYALRRKIETQVAKSVNQHLIIYSDAGQTQQVWQWVRREAGRPTAAREQTFYRDQTGEALIQKLQAIAFSLEEEERLTLVDVAGRVRAGFDVERVTRRFYERFKAEHAGFLKFLRGIPDEAAQRWYASVMINRLMFIYFIQKKGFLDGDPNYLRTRLAISQAAGADRYYTGFLRPLFFQGFARREEERSAEINRLLGRVPYLDGGLFQEHPVERTYGSAIQIADAAFARLFDFFDAYHWHLDERPLRADNEINPDVLGYIFEKYINQKQMGAYYTKEDITGYISQNTIIPYLFDAARRACRAAFEGEHSIWGLLAADPDRYIYPAMRHGAELPLPPEIADGLDTTRPDLLERRLAWNRPAPAEYALPTEIWREVVARRQRYEEVRAKLAAGEVLQINDLITYNLDIRQFAQDVIASCEDPELLRAFWRAIESVTVLDPTVGSGAFLFAALNVLEPLYEACLERMQAFVDDLDAGRLKSPQPTRSLPAEADLQSAPADFADAAGRLKSPQPTRSLPAEADLQSAPADFADVAATSSRPSPAKFSDFRKVLDRVAQHPNRRYFILKSIVVNNLYGVDIMEEAVEICKLRLFLKLVAQVERVEDIEPLPDIDFNVRAGNTLVGYATRAEVERALTRTPTGQGKLMFAEDAEALRRFEERAADVERLFGLFRQQQTELGGQVTVEDKAELRRRLDALNDELNRALAREYGVEPSGDSKSQQPARSRPASATPRSAQADLAKVDAVSTAPTPYARWLASHKPFHWFVEFYGIMRRSGFDVVIGNPPYVELTALNEYTTRGYTCLDAGNLYALVLERSFVLCSRSGRQGFIVPVSSISTDRYGSLQRLLMLRELHYSAFDDRPSRLFDGLEHIRLTIHLIGHEGVGSQRYSTRYNKWTSAERPNLFHKLTYAPAHQSLISGSLPKLSSDLEASIGRKLSQDRRRLASFYAATAQHQIYYSRKVGYFLQVLDFQPRVLDGQGTLRAPSEFKELSFGSKVHAKAALCCLNSSLFYWFVTTLSDCRHVNKREVDNFLVDLDRLTAGDPGHQLQELAQILMDDLRQNSEERVMRFAHDTLTVQSIIPKRSKPIIDEIDRVLARHYGFTDEELDFIINYDIKYRMGDELAADENE